jgi:hypothetical protein
MHLHHNTHGSEKPAIVLMTAHPTPLQLENVFDQALHRLYGIASLLVEVLVLLLLEYLDHALPFRTFVLTFSRRRQQEDVPWSLKLGTSRLIISLTIHENGGHQAFQLTCLQPQAFRLMAAVAHPLESPSQAILTCHHTECTMAIHPTVALTVTPGGIRI